MGIMQRFQGSIKTAALLLGGGGIIDAASGIAGGPVVTQKIPLPVGANANTDIGPISVPKGKTLLRASVYTSTAYTGTTVTIQIGSSAGDASYVAATTIKALGVYALTLVAAAAAALGSLPATPNLFVRIVQTGPTAVGAATLVLEYA